MGVHQHEEESAVQEDLPAGLCPRRRKLLGDLQKGRQWSQRYLKLTTLCTRAWFMCNLCNHSRHNNMFAQCISVKPRIGYILQPYVWHQNRIFSTKPRERHDLLLNLTRPQAHCVSQPKLEYWNEKKLKTYQLWRLNIMPGLQKRAMG